MSVKQLKEILDGINYPVQIDFVESLWMRNDYSIIWNTDNSYEDLFNQEGQTYSVEYYDGYSQYDGYMIVNVKSGFGDTLTMLFNLANQTEFKEGY